MSFRSPSATHFILGEMSRRAGCKASTYTLAGGYAEAVLIENIEDRLVMVTEWDSRTHYLEPGEKVEVVFTPEIRIVSLNNGLGKE